MLLLVNATAFHIAHHGARVAVPPRVNHRRKDSVYEIKQSRIAAEKLRQQEEKRYYSTWLFDRNGTCASKDYYYFNWNNNSTSFAELYGSYKNNFGQRESYIPNWTESLLIFGVACVMVYFMRPI
jgi:hypothetical protein